MFGKNRLKPSNRKLLHLIDKEEVTEICQFVESEWTDVTSCVRNYLLNVESYWPAKCNIMFYTLVTCMTGTLLTAQGSAAPSPAGVDMSQEYV